MKKFLIIQTAFIGDVILATSIIEKLYEFYPDSQIDFLLRKGNEGLVIDHPKLNEVLIWDKKKSKYLHLFQIIKYVRRKNYDYVINVHRFTSSGLIARFSKASNVIGYDKNPQSHKFSEVITHKIGEKYNSLYSHEVNRCLKLVESITDKEFIRPKLYPTEANFSKIAEYTEKRFITISPKSVWFTKEYPEERWIEFIKEVKDYSIYLLGAPGDAERCDFIASQSENPLVTNLAGELSLLESAALISKAEMNYANDSAPVHICSAMNAPVTMIYCSTIKEFGFGPLSDKKFIVESKENLNCRPCGLHGHKECPEGHFKCAKQIHLSQLHKSLLN